MVVCDYSMNHARLGQIVLQAKKSGNLSGFQTFVGRKLTSTEISAIKCLKDFPIWCVEGEKLYFFKYCFKIFQSKRSSHYYQTLGFRNSTFFPSYQPKVLMDEEDDISSTATDDTAGYLSVR